MQKIWISTFPLIIVLPQKANTKQEKLYCNTPTKYSEIYGHTNRDIDESNVDVRGTDKGKQPKEWKWDEKSEKLQRESG